MFGSFALICSYPSADQKIFEDSNMTILIKTLHSGTGDCIFLRLQEGTKQYVIMTDCGSFKDEDLIQHYVQDELGGKIDLLIVTHIDNDHIVGVKDMLLTPGIKVGHIIFNCYQRNGLGEKKKLTKYQQERLSEIERELGLIVGDIIERNVGAPEAMNGLAATILGNPALKRVWDREYTLKGMELDLNEWGKLVFLSPTIKEIEALDKEFRHVLFDELNVDHTMGEWNKKEELFEILLRYTMLQAPGGAAVEKDTAGTDTLEERLEKAKKKPVDTNSITAANKASLAFVWEMGQHKILVMGDANPDIVVKGLIDYNQGKPFPIIFDAIKVSHHGSHYNTTDELLRHADSEHFFFTGGQEGKRPSEEAVGRIVLNPSTEGIKKRCLHFNYSTSLVEELKKDKDLQKKYHFAVDTIKNEQVFTF